MDTSVEREMALVARPKTQQDISRSDETNSRSINPLSQQFSSREGQIISFGNATVSDNGRLHQGNQYVINNYNLPQQHGAAVSKGNEIWLVKRSPNSSFVGRDDALAKMGDTLLPREETGNNGDGSRKYVLHGIGGVGKSELALQFAQKHRQQYWAIFWVDFSSQESMHSSYSHIAAEFGLSATKEDAVEVVNYRLSNSKKPWLLVLDNCDDLNEDYQAHYPENDKGAIIMTTRPNLSVDYGSSGSTRVEGLDPESSLKLLLALSLCSREHGGNEAAAQKIVERVEHHPLAITIAGSIVGRAKLYTLPEYAKAIDQRMKELFDFKPGQKRSLYGTIHATFEVSVKRLQNLEDQEAAAHALELLNILAFLDRKDVGEDIFTRAWAFGEEMKEAWAFWEGMKEHGGIKPVCEENDIHCLSMWHYGKAMSFAWTTSADLGLFKRARSRLDELSLISCDGDTHTVSMHPLLHEWARERLGTEAYAEAWIACAAALALSLKNSYGWTVFTLESQRHLEANFALRPSDWLKRFPKLEVCRIFHLVAWQLYRGESLRAMNVVNEMEKAGLGALDKPDPNDFYVLQLKSHLLSSEGDCDRALEISSMIYEKRRNLLPAKHNNVLIAQSETARLYARTGQPEQAIPLLEEVIDIRKREFADSDENEQRLLVDQHHLAMAYLDSGQIRRAIAVFQTVVHRGEEMRLPREDPGVLSSQHELAYAYCIGGEMKLGISILEQVVEVCRKALPLTQDERFRSENTLISFYIDNDQLSEAQDSVQMIVEDRDANLLSLEQRSEIQDLWHNVKYAISRRHEHSGQISEAIYEMKEVAKHKASSPDDDVEKLQSMIVLARQYLKNEQLEEARQLHRRVKKHEGVLPAVWSQSVVDGLEAALIEFDQTGRAPQWLFEGTYCRPDCPCERC